MFVPLLLRPLWKALLAVAVVALLAILGGRAALERIEERQLAESLPARAQLAARAFGRSIDPTSTPEFARAELAELARRGVVHLSWIDARGHLLADSSPGEIERTDLRALPEVRAISSGAASGFSFDPQRGSAAAVVALEGDAARGFLRLSQPLLALERRKSALTTTVLGASAGLALLLAALLGWNARRLARAMTRLAAQAEAAASDAALRLDVDPPEELTDLAVALQRVATGLGGRLEALARDRNQLRAILASMIEGVVAVDRQGIVLHSNAVAGEILRVPPALARGRRLRETTRVREVSELLEQVLESGESAEREAILPGVGEPRCVQLRASALEDARGVRAGAVVVIHDITALRHLEDLRRDFVANVSHELKTPLTAIQGFIETIVGDPEMPEDLRQRFLLRIQAQSERLYALVQDLLALARIEAHERVLELAPIDPRATLERALESVQPTAEARGVALRAEIEAPTPRIEGEVGALEQIATNLLDNAVKYSRDSGQVVLRLRGEGREVLLEVEDDGIGIEERHQRRIFERFYRVDKARARDVGGTGLGLAIVKHLALALGGEVSVRSQLGSGSTFTVRLQRASS
ncbi:MAG: PAS domain-containing protein [Planctomycetes bacterium]|nr:PAS domain-containing protein [Planctomycetota bacterium]